MQFHIPMAAKLMRSAYSLAYSKLFMFDSTFDKASVTPSTWIVDITKARAVGYKYADGLVHTGQCQGQGAGNKWYVAHAGRAFGYSPGVLLGSSSTLTRPPVNIRDWPACFVINPVTPVDSAYPFADYYPTEGGVGGNGYVMAEYPQFILSAYSGNVVPEANIPTYSMYESAYVSNSSQRRVTVYAASISYYGGNVRNDYTTPAAVLANMPANNSIAYLQTFEQYATRKTLAPGSGSMPWEYRTFTGLSNYRINSGMHNAAFNSLLPLYVQRIAEAEQDPVITQGAAMVEFFGIKHLLYVSEQYLTPTAIVPGKSTAVPVDRIIPVSDQKTFMM